MADHGDDKADYTMMIIMVVVIANGNDMTWHHHHVIPMLIYTEAYNVSVLAKSDCRQSAG